MPKAHIYPFENISGHELKPGECVWLRRISAVTGEPETEGYKAKPIAGIVFSKDEKSRNYFDVLVKGSMLDYYNFSIVTYRSV